MDYEAIKKNATEVSEGQGDRLNYRGRELGDKADNIARLIDRLKQRGSQDDATKRYIEMLERQYAKAFNDAHKEQVENPMESVKSDLKNNKMEIADEKKKLTDAISDVRQMEGISDIGSDEASRTEENITKRAKEYEAMEKKIDDIIVKQESNVKESSRRIQNRFR